MSDPQPVRPIHLEIAGDLLARGQCWRYRETSSSMIPVIRPYDVVVVSPVDPPSLQPGDIVAALRPEGLVVHRLIVREQRGGGEWLILRGDACSRSDPPLPIAALLGRVEILERLGRRVDLRLDPWRRLQPVRRCWQTVRKLWKRSVQGCRE